MFKKRVRSKRKNFFLKDRDAVVQLPLVFNGKSVELNARKLQKGEYSLCSTEEKSSSSIPVMIL